MTNSPQLNKIANNKGTRNRGRNRRIGLFGNLMINIEAKVIAPMRHCPLTTSKFNPYENMWECKADSDAVRRMSIPISHILACVFI
jgi:hypothetical protein